MNRIVSFSLATGTATAVACYGAEIVERSPHVLVALAAVVIQSLHDAVCIAFFALYLSCLRDNRRVAVLNTFYTILMCSFSIWKRCVLTLAYNRVLGLPACTRYVPLWQRVYNSLPVATCADDPLRATYLWLNDHVFQSGLMVLLNLGAMWRARKRSV